MHVHLWARRQELSIDLDLVCRRVVSDDMSFIAARLIGGDIDEEDHEPGRGMSRRGVACHFAGPAADGDIVR